MLNFDNIQFFINKTAHGRKSVHDKKKLLEITGLKQNITHFFKTCKYIRSIH